MILKPKASLFDNLNLKVKINSETYIRFDGTTHLLVKNIHSERGLRIQHDILLILYELVEWKSVGDLIEPWPSDDQEKIKDHLVMLESQHMIITSESTPVPIPESGLSEHIGDGIHINVENHHAMLRDYVRMAAYRRAIERVVKTDSVVLDLGAGSGILSFFAAKAGAKKVFAVERRPDIVLLGQALAEANGLKDQIEFVEGLSSQMETARFQPQPDVLVAEILGNGILEENVLEFTLDARRRFLKPGAQLIPYKLDIHLFAFDSGLNNQRWEEVQALKELYGFDFSLLGQMMRQKVTTRLDRYSASMNKTMSESVCVKSLDFRTLEETFFAQRFTFDALASGQITGFCGYFKVHLDEETMLTNSPWAPATHWTHVIYTLPAPYRVEKGDSIPMEMIYDGALRVQIVE